jgi:Carbamoyl-phosphate synthase L chain, ATP binding domain
VRRCFRPPVGTECRACRAQTLTDKEYQRLRDASVAIIREMGVECGGSNVQMAINPEDGEVLRTAPSLRCPIVDTKFCTKERPLKASHAFQGLTSTPCLSLMPR